MVTTYLSASVRRLLDEAQREIDRHVTFGRDGRCPTCGDEAPCGPRSAASEMFARYGRLPLRRPGLASSRARR
jgi:hypothetical protein